MLASSARANSAATNKLPLVAAVEVELLHTGYVAVNGACGHRLTVVRKGEQTEDWEARIAAGKRHRKRCWDCGQK